MSKGKITKYMREKIAQEVSSDRFRKKKEAIKAKIRKYCESAITKELKGIKFPSQLVNEGFLQTATSIQMYYGKEGYHYDCVSVSPFTQKPQRPFHVPLCKRTKALHEEENKTHKEYREFRDKLTRTLEQLGTYKRVIENLPEIKPYLPTEEASQALVPVETIEKIRCEIKSIKPKKKGK